MPLFKQQPDLLPRFRVGERSALAEVYDTYVERVGELVKHGCRILRAGRLEGGLYVVPEDVLDVVHEVFVRAFSPPARGGYDGVREYGPYLLMIARNTMVDWVRRRGVGTTVSTDWFAEIPSTDPGPDEVPAPWCVPETLAIVEEYLGQLPDQLRQLHHLRYEMAVSQEEAAQKMGISRQNLRTLEGRLRQGLAERLTTSASSEPPTRRTQNG